MPSTGPGGGWSKPEEPAPAPPQPEQHKSALTAGSTWGSAGGAGGEGGYVPPLRAGPFSRPTSSFPVERRLNPDEYPSLAATAKGQGPPPTRSSRSSYDQHQVRRAAEEGRCAKQVPPLAGQAHASATLDAWRILDGLWGSSVPVCLMRAWQRVA